MQTQQNETDGKLGGDVRSEHSAAIHQPVSDVSIQGLSADSVECVTRHAVRGA
jgi:hypothetical protein